MKKLTLLFLFLTGLLILSACGTQAEIEPVATPDPGKASIIAEGHLKPTDDQHLAFQVRGKVSELLVKEGSLVKSGAVLAKLSDFQQAEAAVAAAKFELTSAEQALDTLNRTAQLAHAQAWQAWIDAQRKRADAQKEWEKLDLDNIDDDIADAEADIKDRQEDLKTAQEDFDVYANLAEDNSKRENAYDDVVNAQEDLNTAIRKLEKITNDRDNKRAKLDEMLGTELEAKRTLENTAAGPDVDQLAIANARLQSAQASLEAANEALSQYELTAPFDGKVIDINASVNEQTGPSDWVILMVDTSKWIVETSDLSELDVVNIQVGDQVAVTADALPGVKMTGVVEKISEAPDTSGGDVVYKATIRMDKIDPLLRWGMTMQVDFH